MAAFSNERGTMADNETTEQAYAEQNAALEREAQLAEEYLEGMPAVNIGALVMPPIWGPAKGIWATILWYPVWVFADNVLFAWWSTRTLEAGIIGVLTLVLLALVTIAFARLSRPLAAVRAVQKGKTKEEFQRGERIWAIVSIVIGIAFLAFATYYNLVLRAPLVA